MIITGNDYLLPVFIAPPVQIIQLLSLQRPFSVFYRQTQCPWLVAESYEVVRELDVNQLDQNACLFRPQAAIKDLQSCLQQQDMNCFGVLVPANRANEPEVCFLFIFIFISSHVYEANICLCSKLKLISVKSFEVHVDSWQSIQSLCLVYTTPCLSTNKRPNLSTPSYSREQCLRNIP